MTEWDGTYMTSIALGNYSYFYTIYNFCLFILYIIFQIFLYNNKAKNNYYNICIGNNCVNFVYLTIKCITNGTLGTLHTKKTYMQIPNNKTIIKSIL